MFVILSLALSLLAPTNATAIVKLQLQSVQDTFVVGEPVKFIITISNTSKKPERYIGFEYFRREIAYDVVRPEKMIERRNRCVGFSTGQYEGWKGESLYFCDYVVTYDYPNVTIGKRDEYTFPVPGRYKVHAVYHVENWGKPPLCSNWIYLVLISPTDQQREIFNAYWSGADCYSYDGLSHFKSGFNESAVRSVIRSYPFDPAVKYAYYALLRCLTTVNPITTQDNVVTFEPPGPLDEILEIAEYLTTRYPDFRFVEVRDWTAFALRHNGYRSKALQLYEESLSSRPELNHDPVFVMNVFYTRDGDLLGYYDWIRDRRKGSFRDLEISGY